MAAAGVVFDDRPDAGRRLAVLLEHLRGEHPVVVGIARGGVAVAAEVARVLEAPLDVAVVRKVGAPQNPEFAIGAVAEGEVHVLSERAVRALRLSDATVEALVAGAEHELELRLACYRGIRKPVQLAGATAILVDDGLATGRTALAAVRSLRRRGAARVILAAPVASPSAVAALAKEADQVVCVEIPEDLWAVGYWYQDFRPTTDDEVARLLGGAARSDRASPPTSGPTVEQLSIPIGQGVSLAADLAVPEHARGVVVFAHGSGSSRLSPRNRAVARALGEAGFATVLLDLLTAAEEGDRARVFDIPLLAARLAAARSWLGSRENVGRLPVGYFGASTGAAAALEAAAEDAHVASIVSRGGRPDLARHIGRVRAPTLLIVGAHDIEVLERNRQAEQRLRCPCELAVVPGATHLFEEPGALEQVSRLAIDWFNRTLVEA